MRGSSSEQIIFEGAFGFSLPLFGGVAEIVKPKAKSGTSRNLTMNEDMFHIGLTSVFHCHVSCWGCA